MIDNHPSNFIRLELPYTKATEMHPHAYTNPNLYYTDSYKNPNWRTPYIVSIVYK